MLTTPRLFLIPLTSAQLLQYLACDGSLEKSLGICHAERTIPPALREALEAAIIPAVADESKNYLYSTLWTAVLKDENCIIGELCMMGEPNAAGEVEIGYGTYPEYQGRGFMTEFIQGMVAWLATTYTVVQGSPSSSGW
jgi:Acetyltransferases, including N-acetylases of ribosomal proteins